MAHCLGGEKRSLPGRFVQEELLSGQIQKCSANENADGLEGDGHKTMKLADLYAKERRGSNDGEEGDEKGQFDDKEEKEEEEVKDYLVNHHESEGNMSGDNLDDEPIF